MIASGNGNSNHLRILIESTFSMVQLPCFAWYYRISIRLCCLHVCTVLYRTVPPLPLARVGGRGGKCPFEESVEGNG